MFIAARTSGVAFAGLLAIALGSSTYVANGAQDLHESVGTSKTPSLKPPEAGPSNSRVQAATNALCQSEPNGVWPSGIAPSAEERARGSGVQGTWNPTVVTRTEVFPTSSVVFIESDLESCTGSLYSSNTVVTAGHCLHQGGVWARWVRVYPARHGTQCPFGTVRSTQFYSTKGWVESSREEFDYGAIKLPQPVGDKTGWLGYAWTDDATLKATPVRLVGYSSHFITSPPPPQPFAQSMKEKPADLSPQFVFYAIDTLPGDSGAPVFSDDGLIRAIHTRGCEKHDATQHCPSQGKPRERLNYGVRITTRVAQNLKAWSEAR